MKTNCDIFEIKREDINTPRIVQVHGGKYSGCILTYVRQSALGHVVIIEGMEKTLEATTVVTDWKH